MSAVSVLPVVPRFGPAWLPQNLIEVLPAAVYVCDMNAVIVAFNQRAVKLWGRMPMGESEERFCGAHKLFYPDGTVLPHDQTPMADVLKTGVPAELLEVHIGRPDGTRVPVLVNISPLFDESGRQVGAVNCFQDLTQTKEDEAARKRMQEALHQAQKMEAVGQLTGGLAHDFNNVLMGVAGCLETAQRRMTRHAYDEVSRYLALAEGETQRASDLASRLLAFARKQTLIPKSAVVNELVVNLEDLLRRTMGSRIRLSFDAAPVPWRAMVDVSQFENAVLNLCINARDAMPNGGELRISSYNFEVKQRASGIQKLNPGEYVALCVEDNGQGMSFDVRERAFEPFFTTKNPGSGTGLGLSTVYGFMQQSGGLTELVSTPNRGTAVTLYFPRLRHNEEQVPKHLHLVSNAAHRRNTILVVEDEAIVRALLVRNLQESGYTVFEAADSDAALDMLATSIPRLDLLITDIGLPGSKDGWELLDNVMTARPEIKALVMTGYADMALPPTGNYPKGVKVLSKPFKLRDLGTEVNNLLADPAPTVAQAG